jgi:hypothetical protein
MRDRISIVVLASALAACGGKAKPAAQPAPAAENKIVVAQPAPEPEPAPEPVPEPPPALVAESTGSPACDQYFASIERLAVVCAAKLPPESMAAMLAGRDAMRAAFHQWDDQDPASRKASIDAATDGCKAAVDAIEQAAVALECPLN